MVAAHYKKGDLLNCWTSSSDISGYQADFHEGHGTIGAWHGTRDGLCELTARHGMGTAWARYGHGMGTARARHAICESAFTDHRSGDDPLLGMQQMHMRKISWRMSCYYPS